MKSCSFWNKNDFHKENTKIVPGCHCQYKTSYFLQVEIQPQIKALRKLLFFLQNSVHAKSEFYTAQEKSCCRKRTSNKRSVNLWNLQQAMETEQILQGLRSQVRGGRTTWRHQWQVGGRPGGHQSQPSSPVLLWGGTNHMNMRCLAPPLGGLLVVREQNTVLFFLLLLFFPCPLLKADYQNFLSLLTLCTWK